MVTAPSHLLVLYMLGNDFRRIHFILLPWSEVRILFFFFVLLEQRMTLAFLQPSKNLPYYHDLSKVVEWPCSESASSLSPQGCIPHKVPWTCVFPGCLNVLYPGRPPLRLSSLLQTVPLVTGAFVLKMKLTSEDQSREVFKDLSLHILHIQKFFIFLAPGPTPQSAVAYIFPNLSYAADVLVEAFLVTLYIPCQIQLQMGCL